MGQSRHPTAPSPFKGLNHKMKSKAHLTSALSEQCGDGNHDNSMTESKNGEQLK